MELGNPQRWFKKWREGRNLAGRGGRSPAVIPLLLLLLIPSARATSTATAAAALPSTLAATVAPALLHGLKELREVARPPAALPAAPATSAWRHIRCGPS